MKTIRKPSFKEAIIPIIAMFVILVIGRGVYSAPIETLLIMSATVAAVIAWRVGLTWDDMIEGVSEKIAKAMPAILILIAVGIVVGTWMLSGTIPMLIYYGIQIVNPKFFFVTCFIICAILSTCTGTSWGSCATIGVVLVVIAQGLGISLPITAVPSLEIRCHRYRILQTWHLWQRDRISSIIYIICSTPLFQLRWVH